MRRGFHLVVALTLLAPGPLLASLIDATRISVTIDGVDLRSWGGPVTRLALSATVADSEPDKDPQVTYQSQFGAAFDIEVAGQHFSSEGFLKLSLNPGTPFSEMVLTLPFPGEVFPHYALNTQLSGIELHLHSSAGMLTTERPSDLDPNFAAQIDGASFFYRVGGWAAGAGTFMEYVNPLATFASDVTRIGSVVPEPSTPAMVVLALCLLGLRRAAPAQN